MSKRKWSKYIETCMKYATSSFENTEHDPCPQDFLLHAEHDTESDSI